MKRFSTPKNNSLFETKCNITHPNLCHKAGGYYLNLFYSSGLLMVKHETILRKIS
jgi:hypothetical protein